jgi:hypothetical protein
MNNIVLSRPQFGFVVATRAALGFGIGLLASSRLDRDRRRVLGGMLVAVGALTTIPALLFIRRNERAAARLAGRRNAVARTR